MTLDQLIEALDHQKNIGQGDWEVNFEHPVNKQLNLVTRFGDLPVNSVVIDHMAKKILLM
jgi:hypothetical protein